MLYNAAEEAAKLTPKSHLKYLDGLRAIAALYVLVHHALPNEAHTVFAFGHLAVTLFIVLSGFCLMIPVAKSGEIKGGAIGFFARRWRRILPPYYAALALALFVCLHTTPPYGPGAFLRAIPEHLLLTQDFAIFPFDISAPMWSVAVEWHIYLTFPLIVLAWKRWGTWKTAAGAMALSLAAEQWSPWKSPSMHFYGDFALGAGAALIAFSPSVLCVKWRERIAWGKLSAFGFAALVVLLGLLGSARYEENRDLIDLPFALFTCALLVAGASGAKAVTMFGARPLAFVGNFSYSLYLIHMPLIIGGIHFHTPLWVVIPGIVVAAYVFHLIFERPFMAREKTVRYNEQPSTGGVSKVYA